jgi:hypothetical protein
LSHQFARLDNQVPRLHPDVSSPGDGLLHGDHYGMDLGELCVDLRQELQRHAGECLTVLRKVRFQRLDRIADELAFELRRRGLEHVRRKVTDGRYI